MLIGSLNVGDKVNPRMHYLLEHWENRPKNIILLEVAEYILTGTKAANRDT